MTGRGRTLGTAATIAVMLAAGAGCGGPSAEETRAELRRWASAVDDVCRTTRERIAERGDARDMRDLDRIAMRASEDVRAAVERIRRVPLSEHARPRVRSFLAALEKVEPRLAGMTSTTADGSLKEIGNLGLRLADATKRFQDHAEAAGLRECADPRQFDAVLNAFTAPVYATRLGRVETWLVRELQRLADLPAPTSPALAPHLRRVGKVLQEAERRIGNLYTLQPNRVVNEADELGLALHAYEHFLETVAESLRGGRRVFTPVGARQFLRHLRRHERETRRAIVALRKAVGARPLAVPGTQPPPEPGRSAA